MLRSVIAPGTTAQETVMAAPNSYNVANGIANTFYSASQLHSVFTSNGWLPAGRVAFFVQNTKSTGSNANAATKLYVEADRILAAQDAGPFLDTSTPEQIAANESMKWRNPYLTNAAQSMSTWWGQFRTAWINATLPKIDRAHFDAEPQPATDMFDPRGAFLLYKMQDTTPGSDWMTKPVYGLGKTMAQLWDEVKNKPGFYVPSSGTHDRPLYLNQNYQDGSLPNSVWRGFNQTWQNSTVTPNNNRLIGLWYNDICQRAVAAVKNQAVFQTIRQVDANNRVIVSTNFKSSNYQMSYIRPGTIDFGWQQRDAATDQDNKALTSPQWKRLSQRGFPIPNDWGFDMSQLTPSSTDPQWNKQWLATDTTNAPGLETSTETDNSMSAPVLYAIGKNDTNLPENASWVEATRGSWSWYRQKNAYMPTHPVEGNRWLASLRQHRIRLESIIASEGERSGGSPWLKVSPWIVPPGVNASEFHKPCNPAQPNEPCSPDITIVTPDQSNRQLALLRSKRVPEILVWNPRVENTNYADYYAGFTQVYKQVFEPQMLSIYNDEANATLEVVDTDTIDVSSSSAASPNSLALDAIEDTNERWVLVSPNGGPPATPPWHYGQQRVLRTTNTRNSDDFTAMTTKLEGIARVTSPGTSTVPSCETLRLTLECDVTVFNPCEIANSNGTQPCGAPMHLEGRVRFNHPTSSTSSIMLFPQSDCDGSGSQPAFPELSGGAGFYAFWAPRTLTTDVTQLLSVPNPCKPMDDLSNRATGSFAVQMRRTFDVDLDHTTLNALLDNTGRIKFDLLVRARAHGQNFAPAANITVDWNLIQIIRMPRANPACQFGGEPEAPADAMQGTTSMIDGGSIAADVNFDDAINTLDMQAFLTAQAQVLPTSD
jgi:hypothetical protein